MYQKFGEWNKKISLSNGISGSDYLLVWEGIKLFKGSKNAYTIVVKA